MLLECGREGLEKSNNKRMRKRRETGCREGGEESIGKREGEGEKEREW